MSIPWDGHFQAVCRELDSSSPFGSRPLELKILKVWLDFLNPTSYDTSESITRR